MAEHRAEEHGPQFARSMGLQPSLEVPLEDRSVPSSRSCVVDSGISAALAALGADDGSALHISQPGEAYHANPAMFQPRPQEHQEGAPATWRAYLSEERRRSDLLDTSQRGYLGSQGARLPPGCVPGGSLFPQGIQGASLFDTKLPELSDLASRLPQGLLGNLLETDASDTTSRSTTSRRARLGTEASAAPLPGFDLLRHEESQNLSRLKALLSACAPDVQSVATALAHSGVPCSLPGLTKLISKFNKSDQWRRGLAVFHALPAVGLAADATIANAALGSCDRGAAADSAWAIYCLMRDRNLEADAISYKALVSALCKGGQWERAVSVFARAIEGGVPVEAATVMVLLFALTQALQLQLAEAVFCTAFGMFADLKPLLAIPWSTTASASATASESEVTNTFYVPPPMHSVPQGLRVGQQEVSSPTGSSSNVPAPITAGGSNSSLAAAHESNLSILMGYRGAPGPGSAPAGIGDADNLAGSAPGSARGSTRESAPDTFQTEGERDSHLCSLEWLEGVPGATTTSHSASLPAPLPGAPPASRGLGTSASAPLTSQHRAMQGTSGSGTVTPQVGDAGELLSRMLNLHRHLADLMPGAQATKPQLSPPLPQFPLGNRMPLSNSFLPEGPANFTGSFPTALHDDLDLVGVDALGSTAQGPQQNLLARIVGWQRGHSVVSQTLTVSESSTSLPSCTLSRSNSHGSIRSNSGNSGNVNSASMGPSASLHATPAAATGSPHSSRNPHTGRTAATVSTALPVGLQSGGGMLQGGMGMTLPARLAAALGAVSSDPLCAACCNAMLSAYCTAAVPQVDRAATLLLLLHTAGGALDPDVVAYNTVMQAQATAGHLTGMLQTLTALTSASLRPTASTYAILMHTHIAHGAAQSVLDLWHQMLQSRVLPNTVCLRAYTLAALRVGDTGLIHDATSRYFSHLLTLSQEHSVGEACVFLQTHGQLGPPDGSMWMPGLSPSELCATIMRRGHQGSSTLAHPALSALRAAATHTPPHAHQYPSMPLQGSAEVAHGVLAPRHMPPQYRL